MKRIRYSTLVCSALMVAAIAGAAFATPAPNSANINLRTFNDCALSTLTPTNLYPASITIEDIMHPACVGFANLHGWSFSEDGGVTPALFKNNSNFIACAFVKLDGAGNGEAGLRFGPWWAPQVDGRFMIKSVPGDFIPDEVACFGGRLPFYSFTGAHGVHYVKGTTVYMQITYLANGLSSGSPATIQYRYIDGTGTYDSPALPYDEGNPTEGVVHGTWGCLHDAMVGGYFQPRANTGVGLTATWSEICYTNTDVVPTLPSTWGRMKTLYR
jgi:hypothetical protein